VEKGSICLADAVASGVSVRFGVVMRNRNDMHRYSWLETQGEWSSVNDIGHVG